MLKSLDFSTAEEYDIYTNSYSSISDYTRCELEAMKVTGKKEGAEYTKALADCKLKQKEGGGLFGSMSCDAQCKKAGVKPEDMVKCVADCKLTRREQAGTYFGQIDFGNLFGGLFGRKQEQIPYDSGTTYDTEKRGMGALPIIIGIILLIGFIILIMQLMKKRGTTATAQ
jgi:hypothetical protein